MADRVIERLIVELGANVEKFKKEFSGATDTSEEFSKVLEALRDNLKAAQGTLNGFSAGQAQSEMEALAESVMALDAAPTEQQVKELGAQIQRLSEAGASVPESLRPVQEQFKLMEAGAGEAKAAWSGLMQALMTGVGINIAEKGTEAIVGALRFFPDAAGRAIDKTLALSDELSNLSAKTGMSVDALQRFSFVGSDVGVSMNEIATAMTRFQRSAAGGSTETRYAMEQLGLSLDQIKRMAPEEQFFKIIEALGKLDDSGRRSALSMQLLGRGGAALVPLSENLREAWQKADEYGTVLSGKAVEATDALGDSMGRLSKVAEGLGRNIVSGFTASPMVKDVVDDATKALGFLSRQVQDLGTPFKELAGFSALAAKGFGEVATTGLSMAAAVANISVAISATAFGSILLGIKVAAVGAMGSIAGLSGAALALGAAFQLAIAGVAFVAVYKLSDAIINMVGLRPVFDGWAASIIAWWDGIGTSAKKAGAEINKVGSGVPKDKPEVGSGRATAERSSGFAVQYNIRQPTAGPRDFSAEQEKLQQSMLVLQQQAINLSTQRIEVESRVTTTFAEQNALAVARLALTERESQNALQVAVTELRIATIARDQEATKGNTFKLAEANLQVGLKSATVEKVRAEGAAKELAAKNAILATDYELLDLDLRRTKSALQARLDAEAELIAEREMVDALADEMQGREHLSSMAITETQKISQAWESVADKTSVSQVRLQTYVDTLSAMSRAGTLSAAGTETLASMLAAGRARAASRNEVSTADFDAWLAKQPQIERMAAKVGSSMSAMLGDIKNAFDVLGIGVDSVIGRILGGMAAAAAAGQRLRDSLPKIVTTQNGKTTSKSDFGALFRGGEDGTTSAQKAEAGVAAIAGIASVWKATEADTKAKAAAQGAMAGAAFGAQFGVWGAVAGAAIGGLLGLFRANPAWVRIAREVGAMFGTTISKEMAEAIQKTAKDLKLNVSSASLLHLTEIADASGKGLRSYSAQILDLMDRVNKKQIPMKEGMDQIGKAWSMVRSEADKYEIVGDRVTVQMLKQARAMGMMTAEMKAFVSGKLDSAATGLEKLWSTPTGKKPTASGDVSGTITGGLAPKTEGEARDQATIFSAVFWATVKEKGVVAAADAMREQFAAMKAVLEATGFDASAIVGPMEQMMGLTENEKFRGAAEGVGALDAALKGLADTGYLTTDSFAAIERQAGSAFQQAVAGGLEAGLTQAQAEQQALMAIAPLLQSLQSTAAQYGVELDANTQSLIAQAEASGIAFKTDPTLMLIESINALITTLGGVPPAFNDMAGAGAAASSSTSSSFADAMASMPPAAKTAVMAVDESMVSITTSATLHFSDMQSGWQESMDAMAPAAEVAIEDVRTWLDTLPASATVPINFPLNFPPKPGVNNDGSSDYDGDPTTPYASGGIARGPASGYGVTLHGSEAVIPLGRPSGIASELSALIATAVSQGLGNVKTGQQTIILQIGQEVFKKVIESGTRGGTIRVHKNAIGEF